MAADDYWTLPALSKFEGAISRVDMNRLAFADFAFEYVDAERIENFFLNHAPQRVRAVNGVVSLACQQFLGRIGQLERDLLLLETFG